MKWEGECFEGEINYCALNYACPSPSRQLANSCQKVLFSATYSDEVMRFAETVIPDALIIRLKRSEESLDNIKQVLCQ